MSEKKISPPSMSSAEGSPARTSLTLDSARDSKASEADCGSSLRESFAKWDRASLSWRTSQHSFLEGLATYSELWPIAGMTLAGRAYRLPTLVRRISENESSLWPTPTADAAIGSVLSEEMANRFRRKGSSGSFVEAVAAKIVWPTPTANEDAAGTPNGKMQRMLGNHPDVRNSGTGTLNPAWVEWLMGFPSGWTDLEPSETP
jgi:hypothetical protein